MCSNGINSEKITCSGSCGHCFHYSCVGLAKSHYSSWTANVGLNWFCASCRLNFNPIVYDREKTIMRALRELLIRTDCMDTRLGNFGDNLRQINKTLYGQQHRAPTPQTNVSLDQTSFQRKIDMLSLDDTDVDDSVTRSRSCNETSFFEVLDDINATMSQPTEKFIIGANKRVQIIPSQRPPSTSKDTANHNRASTPGIPVQKPISPSPSASNNDLNRNRESVNVHPSNIPRPKSGPLSVAKIGQASTDVMDFYVTPFTPDQKEEDVKLYIQEITNADPSAIKVVKLVPRGKALEDLSFISFKVSVDKTLSDVIGDPWYWPDGVTVRAFDHTPKNGPPALRPTPS